MASIKGSRRAGPTPATAYPAGVVYIVDDDPAVREYIAWLLRATDLRMELYSDAESFLAGYQDTGPGCLITDLYMPGLSGIDLQQHLTAEGIDLPIIMMSGQAEIATAVRAMREGAVDFLEKPFDG